MRRVLAWTDGQDVQLRSRCIRLSRAYFSIVKHPVALLREERHVHGEALRCAAALVPQSLLRLHEILDTQQRPRQKVPRCNEVLIKDSREETRFWIFRHF